MTTPRTVRVDLGRRSYDVAVGAGLLDELGRRVAAAGRSAVVITDSNVGPLYGRRAVDSIAAAGRSATLIEFPAGEQNKTLATYGRVMDEVLAISPAIDRAGVIVALGGGVAGDVAGFVAATALRGLRWIQCPTSLLADVDASVGGKTGLDHAAGKNLIGAFHQPGGVLIDVETLETLDDVQLRSGLAECIKHGVIRQAELLDFIEAGAEAIFARDPDVLADLVARNVAVKAAVVSADEREDSERAHLNFGHTVGHAIETFAGFGAVTHGEAVSLGMVAACGLAVRRNILDATSARRVEKLLSDLGLPVRRDGLDGPEILNIMRRDKKIRGGKIRMVLPVSLGKVKIFDDLSDEAMLAAVERLRP